MKKVLSCIVALVLMIVTYGGINLYCDYRISESGDGLVYYNDDLRNSCKTAMAEAFSYNAIPVFGSSELSSADDIAFPTALFQNGNSDFNMVLIGRGYMQSLHHAMNVGAYSDIIEDKKVVLILSPQWFEYQDVYAPAYASRFSERVYVEFLKNSQISDRTKEAVGERLNVLLSADPQQAERVKKYESIYVNKNILSWFEMGIYDSFMNLKQKVSIVQKSIEPVDKSMPAVVSAEIDFDALQEEAQTAGSKACTNNELYIYDEYYSTYIEGNIEQYRDFYKETTTEGAKEYDDLKLFLDVCQELEIEPLIISVPVHGKWYDFEGMSRQVRDDYYRNIRDICGAYGVELADFSDKEYEPYFLKDVMHLGWKGWVYLDEAVYEFYQKDN